MCVKALQHFIFQYRLTKMLISFSLFQLSQIRSLDIRDSGLTPNVLDILNCRSYLYLYLLVRVF